MKVSIILFYLTIFVSCFAQESHPFVRKGNQLYDKKKYSDAEVMYRKGLQKDRYSLEGTYNLGNSLFKQENYQAAEGEYKKATLLAKKDKGQLAQVYHNLGNALFYQNKFAESVEAYKSALRLNPKDNDTRKNLVIAQKKLQQQESSSQENEEKQDNKDKQPQEEKTKKEQISQDNAEQILNAFLQDEKQIQQQLQQTNATKRVLDKNW